MKQLLLFVGLLLAGPGLATAQRLRQTQWEKGTLEKGQKTGVWEYYAYKRDGTQVVAQKYDHTQHKLLEYRPLDDVPYKIELTPGQWTMANLDRQPMFIGGDGQLVSYMSKLNYPEVAQDRKLQGRVVVAFVIDTLGRTSDHKVLLGIGGGCDEEALRVCRTIPNDWIPARKNGRAVPVIYELPFIYKLR